MHENLRAHAAENLKHGLTTGVFRAFNLVGDQAWEFSPEVRDRVTTLCGKLVEILEDSEISACKPKARDLAKMLNEQIAFEAAWHDNDYLSLRSRLIPRPGWKGNKRLRADADALYRT